MGRAIYFFTPFINLCGLRGHFNLVLSVTIGKFLVISRRSFNANIRLEGPNPILALHNTAAGVHLFLNTSYSYSEIMFMRGI
jgi:hypothetical protein